MRYPPLNTSDRGTFRRLIDALSPQASPSVPGSLHDPSRAAQYQLTVEPSPGPGGASHSPSGESHEALDDDEAGSLYSDVASSQV